MTEIDKMNKAQLLSEIGKLKVQLKNSEMEMSELHDAIRKQAEAELRHSLDRANLFAFTTNLKGYVVFSNEIGLKITGLSEEEIVNRSIFDFIDFIDLDTSIPYDEIITRDLLVGSNEALITASDGTKRSVQLGAIVIRDSLGEIIGATIVGENLAAKQEKDRALMESEKQFRTIFESIQDIYFRSDLSGCVKLLSPSVADITGYDIKNLIGKNVTDYYLYNQNTKNLLRELVKNKSVRNFEASVVKKSGDIISCLCNIRLIYDDANRPVEIEGVARDISELKQANLELLQSKEIAEKSLEVKEKFLANMSHEIRTPMNGIIGTMDLLTGTDLGKKQKKYVKTVRKSSETLLNLLNDILDLSKIEAGKMALRRQSVSLKVVLTKVLGLFEQQANEKGIKLQYDFSKEIPAFIVADETRLIQVLSNLISNAIKFTKGRGSIMLYAHLVSDVHGLLTIKVDVTDTGIGISREDLHQLFENFTQLDESSTKSFGGTGLGLVISRQLCHLMGGDIGVSSAPGMGSTFWFTFESEKATKVKKVRAEALSLNSQIDFENPPNLLLVDDNKINRDVASQILKKSGFEVKTADSGQSGLDLVSEFNFDLILMDIQMPEMDGLEALKQIRKKLGKSCPPILAMTAYSMEDDREKFISEGFSDYISKPIRAMDLISAVSRWVVKEPEVVEVEGAVSEEFSKIINSDVILSLSKYADETSVRQIYEDFNAEAEQQIKSISDNIALNHFDDALNDLHTIKGTAGTLGVEVLARKAQLLEVAIKENNFINLAIEVNALKSHFADFKDEYKKMFKIN